MELNNRWQLNLVLLERLIDELDNMRKATPDGVHKKKLISLSGSLLDGVTDMARLKKAVGDGDGTSNSLIVLYIEKGLSDDLQRLYDAAKQQVCQRKEIA